MKFLAIFPVKDMSTHYCWSLNMNYRKKYWAVPYPWLKGVAHAFNNTILPHESSHSTWIALRTMGKETFEWGVQVNATVWQQFWMGPLENWWMMYRGQVGWWTEHRGLFVIQLKCQTFHPTLLRVWRRAEQCKTWEGATHLPWSALIFQVAHEMTSDSHGELLVLNNH